MGPGCQPGMAKRAVAGPYEAGSVVVATTNVTMIIIKIVCIFVKLYACITQRDVCMYLCMKIKGGYVFS